MRKRWIVPKSPKKETESEKLRLACEFLSKREDVTSSLDRFNEEKKREGIFPVPEIIYTDEQQAEISQYEETLGFNPAFGSYCNSLVRLESSIQNLNVFMISSGISKSLQFNPETQQIRLKYFSILRGVVAVYEELANAYDKMSIAYSYMFNDENYGLIKSALNVCISQYKSKQSAVFQSAVKSFQNYLHLMEQIKACKNMECTQDQMVSTLTKVLELVTHIQFGAGRYAELVIKVNMMSEYIGAANAFMSSLPDIIHNIEVTLLEARTRLPLYPTEESIKNYLQLNHDFISVQKRFLEHLNNTFDPVLRLWPQLNKDLLRAQEKAKPLYAAALINQKVSELAVYSVEFVEQLLPIIDVITKAELAARRFLKKEGNAANEVALITELIHTGIFRQNALVRFIVLTFNILISSDQCHNYKNSGEKGKLDMNALKKDVEKHVESLRIYAHNLKEVRLMWNGRLFKFLNNFIFLRDYLQKAIGSTELAFLNCEALFLNAEKNDLQFKNQVIQLQLELLEMQNSILQFAQKECAETYVRNFYFKNKGTGEVIYYSTTDRNKRIAQAGDNHCVIHGIVLEDILQRNEARKLKLEAIPLEYQSGQRVPQNSDYTNALCDDELEKFLKEWELEEAQIKAGEKAKEQKHQLEIKKSKDRKLARKAEQAQNKAKEKESREKTEHEKVQAAKSSPGAVVCPLTEKLDELLLLLNPRAFSAKQVKKVIDELYPMTETSNNGQLVFKSLSAIGDSYSMIAGYNLNHKGKSPEVLIVNLKLALNFYSRAELALRKAADISFDEHSHYYTWLQHSIQIQEKLLHEYERKFMHQFNELMASRHEKMEVDPEKWAANSTREGWRESKRTVQRKELKAALQAAGLLKKDCREFKARLEQKVYLKINHQAYGFEHYLHHANKKPLEEEPTSYEFLSQPVKAPEIVEMTASEPDESGIINMVRAAPSTPQPMTNQVTATNSYQLRNHFTYKRGMMYCTCAWVPTFPILDTEPPQAPMPFVFMPPFAYQAVPYSFEATCPLVPYYPAPCLQISMVVADNTQYWQQVVAQQDCPLFMVSTRQY